MNCECGDVFCVRGRKCGAFQSNRNYALKQLWEEEREMAKSEEILMAAEVDAASNILPSAAKTIRQLAKALEHAMQMLESSDRAGSDCTRCNAARDLLRRYKGEA